MRVLVDYQIFLAQQYGGISNYHFRIDQEINKMRSEHQSTIIALGSNNKYIKGQLQMLKPLNIRGRGKRVLASLNRYALERSMHRFDVFHPTYYDNYFLSLEKAPPFVITIHDVIPEKYFKDQKSAVMIKNKKDIMRRASGIIAISETTKRQLLNFYDIDPDMIDVIPHGRPDPIDMQSDGWVAAPWDKGQPYMLYVGLRQVYKNFTFFIRSAASFLLRFDMQLKVAGPPATEDELRLIAELGISDRVLFYVYPSAEELHRYYEEAFCFVFPTLEEGFGIPLLEAAAANCPVVCSDIDIFHEICGDSALYFDPRSGESIRAELERLFSDSSLRAELIRRGADNLANFSWTSAARKTLDVYQKAAGRAASSGSKKITI